MTKKEAAKVLDECVEYKSNPYATCERDMYTTAYIEGYNLPRFEEALKIAISVLSE